MATQPHRRDRRRAAPNTPGGTIGITNIAVFDEYPSDNIINMLVQRPTGIPSTFQTQNVKCIGGPITDFTGWAVYIGTGKLTITSITVTGDNLLQITLSADVVNDVTIVIPSWVPELRDTGGGVNPGGIQRAAAP